MVNYYQVLGLTENATSPKIKGAFKKLAVKYHPDKHPDDPQMEEKFKEINEAYQILSNPHEKTKHDARLAYRRFLNTPQVTHPYNIPNYRFRRPSPYWQKADYRKNTIATAYAFGITFAIALVVMLAVWIKKGYDEIQFQNLLEERRAIYNQAKESFENDDYAVAFKLMSSLTFFSREEKDIKLFKDNLTNELVNKAKSNFSRNEFDNAIYLLELIHKFEPSKPLYDLEIQLAEAYKRTNQPLKSIEILEGLLIKEYRIVGSLIEIAEIHRDLLKNLESAKEYYQTAHKLAVKQYKNFYGEAYPLVINEKYVPTEHYRLYTGLADIYYQLNDPIMAIKAAEWNKYVWPDSSDAYVISGKAYLLLDMEAEACKEFKEASKRNWSEVSPVDCI